MPSSKGFSRFNHGTGVDGRPAKSLVPDDAVVEVYRPKNLGDENTRPSYSKIKSEFKQDLSIGDRRFILSEHVANQLSVEAEEQRRFEKKVSDELNRRLAAIENEAFQKGFEEGSEKGRADAYEAERARLAKLMESMAAGITTIEDSKQKLAEDYTAMLSEMAFRIAKIIVRKEITDRPESISSMILDMLTRVSRDEDVKISVSPQVYEAISVVQEQMKAQNRSGRVQFEVDNGLGLADCKVDSRLGEISSQLEERIEKLKAEFFQFVGEKKLKTGTET